MAEVTVGGDRLGSGKKITQELHNYGMNSFNQERDWKSSMAPGILYPCFKEIGTNHGTFDIDVDSFVRTLPTKGPLFGSYKLQVDFFNAPFRLYQGILHNNPVDIGLNMNQVYLPKMVIETVSGTEAPKVSGSNFYNEQVNESALLKYLGLSGIGRSTEAGGSVISTRKLQCVPVLAYYDIFKNYYSNKQEENAYVITPGEPEQANFIKRIYQPIENGWQIEPYEENEIIYPMSWSELVIVVDNTKGYTDQQILDNILINSNQIVKDLSDLKTAGAIVTNITTPTGNPEETHVYIAIINSTIFETQLGINNTGTITFSSDISSEVYTSTIELTPFALKNIDKMRAKLLSNNELGQEMTLQDSSDDIDTWGYDSGEDGTGLPYISVVKTTDEGITWNAFEQNGLVVKTYQSDIFNNWLDNTFVAQIQNRVKIDTSAGYFTPDTLILQEKIYSLLNRILVSGGTYYDWQEATYGEGVMRMVEIPMYIGGMSAEVMFEEVISSSETKVDGDYQALGSLGGKGTQVGKKGGENIHVRIEEPSYIMAIVSLTPRICYTQGNDWDLTELDTLDDLHKPELDQIGFQDMMVEQLAWWNTRLKANAAGGGVSSRDSYGKQIAWINYQTAVDKAFGDFAKTDGYAFMVLSRNYEKGDTDFAVKDITTYIDPAKYNYAFAYDKLDANNFWVQLHFKVTARRKMGAQQLPNL